MRNKQLSFGALLSYAAIVFNILSGLLYIPWMIRTIGEDQYALYTLALSVINIFLLDFGIGSAVQKFLSNYYAREQYEEADRFMGIVYKVFIAISVFIALILTVFYFFIDDVYVKLSVDERVVFKNLYIIVAAYSVLSFPFTTFNGVLMANERFIEVKACNLGAKMLSVALIIVFLISGRGVYALILTHAFSNILFLVVKYYFIQKKTKQRTQIKSWDNTIAKGLFSYSAWFTVMSIAQRCIFNIMPSLIAMLIGSVEVTFFSVAATLEGYVYTLADAVNGMFMPRISKILAKENSGDELTGLMIKIGRFHVYTIGLLFIGFICIGQDFITAWMGAGYESVYLCAAFLIFPSLIYVPQQVAHTALLAKDVVKEQAWVYVGMAITNVILSVILLPILGILGAAISVCVAYLLRTVGMNVLFHKRLPVRLKEYFVQVYKRWIIVAALVLLIGLPLGAWIPLGGWLGVGVKALLIGALYMLFLLVFCIDKATKARIAAGIQKKLSK